MIAEQLACIKEALPRVTSRAQRKCMETNLTRLTNLQAKIKRNNTVFNAASPAEKRVMIAKEVIEQVKERKIAPTKGLFLRLESNEQLHPNWSLQETLLAKENVSCQCCGIGSVVISCTLLNGIGKVRDLANLDHGSFEPFINGLHECFSADQLYTIESAFEKFAHRGARTANFGRRYRRHDYRLIAIMKNIIKNNGTFKP